MQKIDKQNGGISTALVLIVLVVLAAAVFLLLSRNDNQAEQGETTQNQPTDTTQGQQGNANQAEEAAETHVIVYADGSYSPTDLSVKTGDTVTFKNQSERNIWPASNVHPTHAEYSEFDPRRAVEPGEDWSFTFARAGDWGYHDHLRPELTGTITVE